LGVLPGGATSAGFAAGLHVRRDLIALAANEIVMSGDDVLGPVDPQVDKYPAASILKAVAKKPVAETDDNTLILVDQAEKALSQVRESVSRVAGQQGPRGKGC